MAGEGLYLCLSTIYLYEMAPYQVPLLVSSHVVKPYLCFQRRIAGAVDLWQDRDFSLCFFFVGVNPSFDFVLVTPVADGFIGVAYLMQLSSSGLRALR